jgi:hypothetical protein
VGRLADADAIEIGIHTTLGGYAAALEERGQQLPQKAPGPGHLAFSCAPRRPLYDVAAMNLM